MHILVSNHNAEIAAFRSGVGSAALELQIVENNLSALSVIGNRTGDVSSLVITEHQDQAVNIDTEVFVQNIVPRLLDSTIVVVVGSLIAAPAGVRQVETIGDAATLVGREPELVGATAEPKAVAKRNGHHKKPVLAELLTIASPVAPVDAPAEPAPAAEETKLALPDPSKTVLLLAEPEVAPPVPEQPAPQQAAPAPVLPAADAAPGPVRQPADAAPVARQAPPPPRHNHVEPAAPLAAPLLLPDPQVMAEIPETTRSLADDIRDWNARQRDQRKDTQASDKRQATFGELLRSWLPGQRRLREQENDLDNAIRSPRLRRCNSIAVISPKGGVGKSFLTYLVGNFLAEVRGDKVIAIDTNPDFGTLADQVRGREEQTISSLLEQIQSIQHYSDLRRFTSKVQSRLEVLAAPADPDVMATITSQEYSQVFEQLHHYYDTVMFDCGTGFRDDITRFALKTADQIVLVSAPLFITTGIVIRAIGYLDQIGCDLGRVTLAINQVRQEQPLDIEYMRSRFGSRLNAIVEVPFDMQLYHRMDRGEFSVEHTQPSTRIAVKQLIGEVVRHFE